MHCFFQTDLVLDSQESSQLLCLLHQPHGGLPWSEISNRGKFTSCDAPGFLVCKSSVSVVLRECLSKVEGYAIMDPGMLLGNSPVLRSRVFFVRGLFTSCGLATHRFEISTGRSWISPLLRTASHDHTMKTRR